MKPFLSVYGHVSIDQIMSVTNFPLPNTTTDVISKNTKLGGTGTNISVMAAALGVPTAICSFVGSDFPKDFEKFMASKDLIMNEFIKVEGFETSQAIVVNDISMEQRVLFYQGPQGSASSLNHLMTKNAKESSYVHFCTGEPKYYISVMNAINGQGKIALDPAQEIHKMWNPKLLADALSLSDALFCNQHEAKIIMQYLNIDSLSKIDKQLVVCTRGMDGSDIYINGKFRHFDRIEAKKTVDVTGAGDAFRAGYYAGRYRKYSMEESFVIATATASFVVEEIGALSNIPSWDQVMERADKALSMI